MNTCFGEGGLIRRYEKASARVNSIHFLLIIAAYDFLRGDPRFEDLLRRVGLAQQPALIESVHTRYGQAAALSTAGWPDFPLPNSYPQGWFTHL